MLIEKRIPLRYLSWKVRVDVPVVLAASVVIAYLSAVYNLHLPEVPLAIPAFMGTAISLLLSFKLSQSYDRWWEARKVWGAIVNDSRSLARQVLTFPARTGTAARSVVLRQIAWCYCLGETLRGRRWSQGPTDTMSAADRAEASTHANPPLALLQQHARDLGEMAAGGDVSDYQRVAVDATISRLTDHMGKAERIRNTVFPTTYRMFLHVAIYLFVMLFIVSLERVVGFWSVGLVVPIATVFFFLEKTATHMQDPFRDRPTDTAMTALARTIEINLRQLLGQSDVPPPLAPNGFYLM